MKVRAKKYLGQHFLTDKKIAHKMADIIANHSCEAVLEIGPGMGVLTHFLLEKYDKLFVVELDRESVAYLKIHYPQLDRHIIEGDFLKLNFSECIPAKSMAVIGNFPYNISSQIVFKILENSHFVPIFGGMFQREVARRIAAKPGSKTYGILSVLTQAFYEVSYCFTVPPSVFNPPPKVDSGVIIAKKYRDKLPIDHHFFKSIVKTAFGQRRKTLRNSLKVFNIPSDFKKSPIFAKRPEQLDVSEFIGIAAKLSQSWSRTSN